MLSLFPLGVAVPTGASAVGCRGPRAGSASLSLQGPPGLPCPQNAARERSRVRALRRAFLSLQAALPAVPPGTKLSKLDILVLATSYIAHLSHALGRGPPPPTPSCPLHGHHPLLHPLKVRPPPRGPAPPAPVPGIPLACWHLAPGVPPYPPCTPAASPPGPPVHDAAGPGGPQCMLAAIPSASSPSTPGSPSVPHTHRQPVPGVPPSPGVGHQQQEDKEPPSQP